MSFSPAMLEITPAPPQTPSIQRYKSVLVDDVQLSRSNQEIFVETFSPLWLWRGVLYTCIPSTRQCFHLCLIFKPREWKGWCNPRVFSVTAAEPLGSSRWKSAWLIGYPLRRFRQKKNLNGSGRVTKLRRHKRNNIRPIFPRNRDFSNFVAIDGMETICII